MEAPALDKAAEAWNEAEEERIFWQANYQKFLERYPDQFVAVRDREVLATSYDLRDLLVSLAEQEVKPEDVWIHFFESKPQAMML